MVTLPKLSKLTVAAAGAALACSASTTTTTETATVDSPEPVLTPASGEIPQTTVHTIHFPEVSASYETREIPLQINAPLEFCDLPEAHFEYDENKPLPQYELELQAVAACLQSEPYTDNHIDVIGYTDAQGPEEYNRRLGMQRAEYVKKILVENGVDPSRIHTETKGEAEARAQTGENSRGYDRRVDLVLTNFVAVPSY